MTTDILQLLINSSGAAVVTGLFVYYLIKKDKRQERKDERMDSIINGYLKDSISVKKDLAEKLQRNTDVLETLETLIDHRFRRRTVKEEITFGK